MKYKNSTSTRKAVELTLKQIPKTAGSSVMVSTGKRKGNLRYCHLAKFQKKEVSSQAGKKQNKKQSFKKSSKRQSFWRGKKKKKKKKGNYQFRHNSKRKF